LENPTQLNTNQVITKKSITDVSNIESINPDGMGAIEAYREVILANLDYDILCGQFDKERLDEIVELIVDILCSGKRRVRIGGEDKSAEVVKRTLLKLDSSHVEYVFDCLDKNTTKIRNIKQYLLTALYNAPATIGHYYQAEVNHDLYGGGDG
jgi:hypothetical protein